MMSSVRSLNSLAGIVVDVLRVNAGSGGFDLGQVRGEAEAEQRPFEVSPAASSQLISSTCRAKPCHSLSNSIFLPEAMQSWPQQPQQPQQPQN